MQKEIKTLREIHNQPATWRECFKLLEAFDLKQFAGKQHPAKAEWVFVGCGTSYYLAQAAAASFTLLTGQLARAVPASEIILHPGLTLPDIANTYPVLISRSGHTSEVLTVGEYLNKKGIKFLALTCDGNELAELSECVMKLPVKEESTVMTSSFTSMLLSMQYLAASIADDKRFIAGLEQLPTYCEGLLKKYGPQIELFAAQSFKDFAVLGQGGLYAIASEVALKVMEASSSYAQFFHTLEFRHGPKSIITEDVLVAGLISESGYEEESKVIQEMKQLGAHTLVIANAATPELRASSDLLIELALPIPELARLCAYVLWGQLFGCYAGLAKGLDPDEPTNLSRVVTF